MDIKEYNAYRQNIVEQNSNLVGVILNQKEQQLDKKLTQLKEEFKNTCEGRIPYDIPALTDERITDSNLYKFCMGIPKGSDLHVHGTSLLPIHKLIDFVLNQEKLYINVETKCLVLKEKCEGDKNCMPLGQAFYNGFFTRHHLEKIWSIQGASRDSKVWTYFENIFAFFDAIDQDMEVLKAYYKVAIEDYLENNTFNIELHVLLSEDLQTTLDILNTIKAAYFEEKKIHPELFVSVIGCSMKMYDISMNETNKIFENTVEAQKIVKDDFNPENIRNFVLGFDLINEEDSSRPLQEYAPILMDFKSAHPEFKFYLHCGESLDAQSDNLIDAYLINAERVGHGMNLYRYPKLLKNYADKEICLESCLISNQRLQYTEDLRLHPAMEYLKRGVTIALCSDDPAFFEYEPLTDDFFAAIICWNLGVAEIKQLCLNSIFYSGLNQKARSQLMQSWKTAWQNFLDAYCN